MILANILVRCYGWYCDAFINLINFHHGIIKFHRTTSRSKSFQTKFWPLALLNYFIHGTHPPSSKKFSIILHDVAATTLTVAMTRVPTLLACMLVATTWSDERANPSFACKLFARRCCHQLSYVVTLWKLSPCWWRALLHPPRVISLPFLLIIWI